VTGDRIDPLGPLPPYRQIAAILRRRIESGQYPPDTRIPTESELMDAFEVARTTARRAIAALREEGLIYTVPQRGSYVTRKSL
jgi:DNA-binding GntR family transcriptional regulator